MGCRSPRAAGLVPALLASVLSTVFFASPLFAQLACDGAPEGFGGGLPPGWTVRVGPGSAPESSVLWADLAGCGEAGNFTGGGGGAACASSDRGGPGGFDTELHSPLFDLTGAAEPSLRFVLNLQSLAGSDRLDVDLSPDGGSTWVTLRSFGEDYGRFRAAPGEDIEIDLSPWSGQSGLSVRWRWHDASPEAFGWYVQIDDVALVCDPPPLCGPGARDRDRLAGGGFEEAEAEALWQAQSARFGSPICTADTCGFAGAGEGTAWVFFGGAAGAPETASIEQAVVLQPDAARLRFDLWMPRSSGNGEDRLGVLLDDTEVVAILESDARFQSTYRRVEVDLSTFADGASHALRFEAITSGVPGHTSFFVDGVSLAGCPDVTALPEMSIADRSAIEGDVGSADLVFPVRLSHPWPEEVRANFSTADATASAGADYAPASGSVVFAAGDTEEAIAVAVLGDLEAERDETFSVMLAEAVGVELFDAEGEGRIVDDDAEISIAGAVVDEGDFGTVTAVFPVSLSHPASRPVTVDFATRGLTAAAGIDFEARGGTLTFPPGQTEQSLVVPVLGDLLDETDETFRVELTHPVAAKLGAAAAEGTIRDDDTTALAITGVTVVEGDAGATPARFLVTLSTPSSREIRVSYATADGTARAGSDYGAQSGTLTVPAGEPTAALTVEVLGDRFPEEDETFTLNLANPVGAVLADPVGVATIADDDQGEIGIDLVLSKSDGRSSVTPGELLTYVITVENLGVFPASGVVLTDTLPPPTSFVEASDGGTEAAGVVTWPAFEVAAESAVTRSVTVRLEDPVPADLTAITNAASAADDGAHGPDAAPENNTAADTDAVTTVRAEAGGPYGGEEGSPIPFDASGSSDRDGTLVAYAWDLDGDGEFDDGSGVTVTGSFPDNGTFTVTVEVTDDSGEVATDTAEVVVTNAAPVFEAGPDPAPVLEGEVLSLTLALFTDPGTADTHTATIDWGDGSSSAGTVTEVDGAGSVEGGHVYADDGVYAVEICLGDDDGATVCDALTATLGNAAPVVVEAGDVDLGTWTPEHLGSAANWSVAADGLSVTQTRNVGPSVFYGPFTATGVVLEGSIRVATSGDDDFIGFVLGFQPGDFTNPDADYLLIDWKQGNQTSNGFLGRRGLAVSRVTGVPTGGELWGHADDPANGPQQRVQELQRGLTRGSTGWADFTTYTFTFETSPTHVKVFVNGTLEIDIAGDFNFGSGRFAFYNYSQGSVVYNAFTSQGLGILEGGTAVLEVPFHDLGTGDTHTATLDWGDGTLEPGTVSQGSGAGTVSGSHIYPDDGAFGVEVCVTDDDGGSGCGSVPVTVLNVAPAVEAGGDRLAYAGEGLTLGAGFTDPGVPDTHTAVVDWGDGTVETAEVTGTGGAGTAVGFHEYAAVGPYTVEVCVTDDGGGTGCDRFEVTWLEPAVDMAVEKTAGRTAVRPGETLTYTVTLTNRGTREPENVLLTDTLPPAHLAFVAASDGGVFDPAAGTVIWQLPVLPYLGTVTRSVTVQAAAELPFGATVINSVTAADDGRFGADETPADNQAAASVLLWDGFTPRLELGGAVAIVEGEELALAVPWDDVQTGETHTATLDWGDGTVEAGVVSGGALGGTVTATHTYGDDLETILEVCVTDSAGHTGCAEVPVSVANAVPDVNDDGDIDLRLWQTDHYDHITNQPRARWNVAADGRSVLQVVNSRPSVFYGDFPAFGTRITGRIRVETGSDDDFIGFALGYRPGDTTNENADFLLLDWKQNNQTTARRGMAVSRITGTNPSNWSHATNESFEEIARAFNLGNIGWRDFVEYKFTFEFSAERLRVFVDDVLEFDLAGEFQEGRLTFYNYSQSTVRYSAFELEAIVIDEGETATLNATFTDLGGLDTHTATLDWRDGAVTPAEITFSGNTGFVTASHLYPDDALYETELCVTDDDGGTGCGIFPVLVRNVAPAVEAGEDRTGFAGVALALDSPTFADPGTLDTHTATIDWGDGTLEAGTVTGGGGAGTVTGSHVYGAEGLYTVEVCVTDDDGGSGCDGLEVEILDRPPQLTVDDVTVDENAGEAVFTVTLSIPTGDEVTVGYATADGTAREGEDYLAVAGTLVFPPGTTSQTLAVPVVADELLEPDQTFLVRLADPSGAEIGDGEGVGTILDDEVCAGPNLLTNPGAEERPAAGQLPGWTPLPDTPAWQRRLAPPEPVEGDATFFSGAETFAEQWQDVDVRAYAPLIDGDGQVFAFEGFVRTFEESPSDVAQIVVEYRDAANQGVLDRFESGEISSPFEWRRIEDVRAAPAGTGWIRVRLLATRFTEGDNDAYFDALSLASLRTAVLTVGDVEVFEGDTGTTDAEFNVTLSCPVDEPVTVAYTTADGTAVVAEDYLAASGELVFEPGTTSLQVPVPVVGDEVHEAHEVFHLDLSELETASELVVLPDPRGDGRIVNDDFCPRSPGFWKTHPELWPVEYLGLGGVEYGREELEAFLGANARDATLALARQLVATNLNLAVGSDPAILPTVEAADLFLAEHPPGSDPRGPDRQRANELKDALDAYNNPDCEETPVIPASLGPASDDPGLEKGLEE